MSAASPYHGCPQICSDSIRKAASTLHLSGECREKTAGRAIEIAERARIPLKMAAKVNRVDQEYFESRIKPRLDNPLVEFGF